MPKGGATSLTPVWAGLQDDLNDCLRAFLRLKSHRFQDYKNMFKFRGMIKLFNGRSNSAEIIEFNELLLVYCIPYMNEFYCPGTKRSIEQRLFGLYSLFTFFYLQQKGHVVKIRMDAYAMESFRKLALVVAEECIYDAVLCCSKLLQDRAIKVVAFSSVYDPSQFKHYRESVNLDGLPVVIDINDPLSTCKELLRSDSFLLMDVAHDEYTKLRDKVGISKSAMTLFHPGEVISSILKRNIKEADIGLKEDVKAKPVESMPHSCFKTNRLSIKEKAYTSEVKLPNFRRQRLRLNPECFTELETIPETPDVAASDFDYENEKFENHNDAENLSIVENDGDQKEVQTKNNKKIHFEIDKKDKENVKSKDKKSMVKATISKKRECPEVKKQLNKEPPKRKRQRSQSQKRTSVAAKKPVPQFAIPSFKPPGRRTNNSLASELFCLDGLPAVKRTLKKRNSPEHSELEVEVEVKKSEEKKVEEPVEDPFVFTKTPKVRNQRSKSVSFKVDNNGDLFVIEHRISPRPRRSSEQSNEAEPETSGGIVPVLSQLASEETMVSTKTNFYREVKREQSSEFENRESSIDDEENPVYTPTEVKEWFAPLENEESMREEEMREAFDISLDDMDE